MLKVAKALIFDAAGQVLILRRSDTHPRYPLHDDLPGGVVDAGETPAVSVVREIYEEAGLAVELTDLRLLHEESHGPFRRDYLYTLTLKQTAPVVTISWEHDVAYWLHPVIALKRPQDQQADHYYTMAMAQLRAMS